MENFRIGQAGQESMNDNKKWKEETIGATTKEGETIGHSTCQAKGRNHTNG